jgi:hypothetical protein
MADDDGAGGVGMLVSPFICLLFGLAASIWDDSPSYEEKLTKPSWTQCVNLLNGIVQPPPRP